MDGLHEEDDVDVRYYSVEGERVARRYAARDFLACPETRYLLVTEEQDRYELRLEPIVRDHIESLCADEQRELSTVFGNTTPGALTGALCALLRSFIVPEYDFNMFGRDPNLAAPLGSFLEAQKK
jgi:hypothetical protein